MISRTTNRIWVCVVFVLLTNGFAEPADRFDKGVIIEQVSCLTDDRQSYGLYLPGRFNQKTRWPVLFAFDPGGRTRIPLRLFQPAAERFGFIVVCPGNAKNGPWEPIIAAMKAVAADVWNRFSIDPDRIYTAGFSGGARAAAAFFDVTGLRGAGIIACGAGLPSQMKPDKLKTVFFHGIVGLEDFNHKELLKLGTVFAEIGVRHFIEVIEGGHGWPVEEICFRALEGMEIRAMKDGLRPVDAGMIGRAFDSALERAMGMEQSDNLYQAVRYYQYIMELFSGLKHLNDIPEKMVKLRSARSFKKSAREVKQTSRKEWDFIGRFIGVFKTIREGDTRNHDLRNTFRDLGIVYLNRQVEKSRERHRRALARRLLRELELKGNAEGTRYLEEGDTSRAVIFFEISAAADPSGVRAFYRLARIYAGLGERRKALKNLGVAVENLLEMNAADFRFLMEEKDFDPIRGEAEFQDLLRKAGLKK